VQLGGGHLAASSKHTSEGDFTHPRACYCSKRSPVSYIGIMIILKINYNLINRVICDTTILYYSIHNEKPVVIAQHCAYL